MLRTFQPSDLIKRHEALHRFFQDNSYPLGFVIKVFNDKTSLERPRMHVMWALSKSKILFERDLDAVDHNVFFSKLGR